MAQDNGNIVAFCTTHNHENIIVNIPALIEAALLENQELTTDAEKVAVTVASITDGQTDVRIAKTGPDAIPAEQPTVKTKSAKRSPKPETGA